MLILSRKADQRILIGENIELVVISVKRDRVRLGFNAPREVPILREEVHLRIPAARGASDSDGGAHQTHGTKSDSPDGIIRFHSPETNKVSSDGSHE